MEDAALVKTKVEHHIHFYSENVIKGKLNPGLVCHRAQDNHFKEGEDQIW